MTDTPDPGDAPAVWLLAVGQTLGFAALYYAFGALLVPIGSETGWTKAELALGPTLALVVTAATQPFAGRLIDRGRGVELLTLGAAGGGLALLVLSQSRSLIHWYLAWALTGPAMAASLYEACFAFLTRRLGGAARAAIIRVTLVGGLASTLAFPLGAVLSAHLGWRGAYAGFGLLEICVAAPAMYYAGVRLRRRERRGGPAEPVARVALGPLLRQRGFWLLSLGFTAAWMDHLMLVSLFIPLFTGLGAGAAMAVAAASTVGPFQVIGRLMLMAGGHRVAARGLTLAAFVTFAVAATILLAAEAAPRLIFAFAVLQGAAIGVLSILRPLLVAEVMGRENFGAISGAIAIGPLLGTAVAPLIGAALFGWGGPTALISGALVLGLAGFALIAGLPRRSG